MIAASSEESRAALPPNSRTAIPPVARLLGEPEWPGPLLEPLRAALGAGGAHRYRPGFDRDGGGRGRDRRVELLREPEEIARGLRRALAHVAPQRLFACTACGLVLRSREAAAAKMRALVAAAHRQSRVGGRRQPVGAATGGAPGSSARPSAGAGVFGNRAGRLVVVNPNKGVSWRGIQLPASKGDGLVERHETKGHPPASSSGPAADRIRTSAAVAADQQTDWRRPRQPGGARQCLQQAAPPFTLTIAGRLAGPEPPDQASFRRQMLRP